MTIRWKWGRLILAYLWQQLAVCDRTCSLRPSLSKAPCSCWKTLRAASWHLLHVSSMFLKWLVHCVAETLKPDKTDKTDCLIMHWWLGCSIAANVMTMTEKTFPFLSFFYFTRSNFSFLFSSPSINSLHLPCFSNLSFSLSSLLLPLLKLFNHGLNLSLSCLHATQTHHTFSDAELFSLLTAVLHSSNSAQNGLCRIQSTKEQTIYQNTI